MADTKLGLQIPQQSVIYIVLCLIGLLVFLGGGILPATRSLAELDDQIADAKYRLEEQKMLIPLLQSLRSQSERKESQVLPLPEKGKLPQARIDTLPMTIGTAAKMSGLTLISALPNLSVLTGDAQFLPMDVVLRGDFVRFRKFLIQIGGLPFVHHIEEITVQVRSDVPEFRLKIWVALG